MNRQFRVLLFLLVLSFSAAAQSVISGKVIDSSTSLPVDGVNVFNPLNSSGTITNSFGEFTMTIDESTKALVFTALGYQSLTISIDSLKDKLKPFEIALAQQPYSLGEITIRGGVTAKSNNPVSISNISSKTISKELGERPLPLVMQFTPGVYSVRSGGGSGDARLTIRGFQQEDLMLMLNGIPVSSEENGLVYWSNWIGLSYAASDIQIQKSAGLSNSSIFSVGGSVNFITKNPDNHKSTIINTGVTSYGNYTASLLLNSGLMDNGWNTTALFSFETGTGYVDATDVKSMAYYLSATKKINNKQTITIDLIGAPQRHGQRTLKLTNEEVEKHGLKYNKDWGGFEGQQKNASVNFYHNPFLSINHDYLINKTNSVTTSLYVQGGYGGGQWSESFNYAPSVFSYRDDAGQIDWDAIYSNNANNTDEYTLANGETVTGYSINVQTNYLASHIKAGVISDYEHYFNDNLRVIAGVHYKYFNSCVREKIDDLLGGEFFIEDYAWSLAGVAGRNEIKTVGDIIRTDNGSIINYVSLYSRLIYNNSRLNAVLLAGVNNNWYQRIDRFNYIDNTKSDVVSLAGYNIRSGASYKITEYSNVFINGAYISRTPYFKFVFGNYNNNVVRDIENEQITSAEAGYNYSVSRFNAKASVYYTERHNVSMLTNEHIQLEDNTQTRAMINGLNSVNTGFEAEISAKVTDFVSLGGMLSLGDFKWTNNVEAKLLNDNNVVVDTVNVYVKGIYTGGTAQQQYGIFGELEVFEGVKLKAEYIYLGGMYADFDPTTRNDPADMAQPYRIPDYGFLNVYLNIPFNLRNTFAQFQLNGYNVLNDTYIVMGEDGADHSLDTFKGFWSFGTNLSCSLTLMF